MGKHQQKWDGGCVVVPSFFLGDTMGDFEDGFRRSYNRGSSGSMSEKINLAAKKALGLSSPDDDEEEKRRRQAEAIARRAKFFSDTSDGGGE